MKEELRRTARVSLDWSRLLGFDQIQCASDVSSGRIGAKVGVKPGTSQARSLVRVGAKVGVKPTASA